MDVPVAGSWSHTRTHGSTRDARARHTYLDCRYVHGFVFRNEGQHLPRHSAAGHDDDIGAHSELTNTRTFSKSSVPLKTRAITAFTMIFNRTEDCTAREDRDYGVAKPRVGLHPHSRYVQEPPFPPESSPARRYFHKTHTSAPAKHRSVNTHRNSTNASTPRTTMSRRHNRLL
jgi:hypothetical protein